MNPAKWDGSFLSSHFLTSARLGGFEMASLKMTTLALVCGLTTGSAFAANMTTTQGAAHASHTQDNRALAKLSCAECHAPVCSPTGSRNVVFGALAATGGITPTWNATGRTCSNVYCHGSSPAPVAWTYVYTPVAPTLAVECAMCHGYPPSSHDAGSTSCNGCHSDTVKADGTIDFAKGKHINGTLEFSGGTGGAGCASCHGFPPATGAHVAHFGPTGITTISYTDTSTLENRFPNATPTSAPAVYAYGCANCHSVISGNHRNGSVDVKLYEAAAPAGSIKARNAITATYDPTAKTCNGVYCHSSGQASPTFIGTPGWNSGVHLGCAGCHTNPPAYASGGAGSFTANSHLNLADDGYEFGHFLGMPGAWHTSKHGGNWSATDNATPITCQTCHYETTDPSNTGPSGFYYLDTTGNYAIPGGDSGRIGSGWQASIQCGYCHKTGGATTGTGKILPLRHVNGARDVVFDPRTTVPAIPWLPAFPNTPTLPYWVTDPGLSGYWPSGLTWIGTTLSFGLNTSTYEPATKTCTSVACHVAEQRPVWGTPYQYYTNSSATCYTCHPM